ncbi:hypothetical protein HNP48_003673 [Acidovorax soli]|uniref:Uncharacterized protein n=1 Tax=Acidovorax soli TaxID=592050 RepID=A0A7X0UAV8_9BURK|nr:hypothetical protein [Acidovorax soli]MBB6560985.1 hypothetical protein [Acidovorax soli]
MDEYKKAAFGRLFYFLPGFGLSVLCLLCEAVLQGPCIFLRVIGVIP